MGQIFILYNSVIPEYQLFSGDFVERTCPKPVHTHYHISNEKSCFNVSKTYLQTQATATSSYVGITPNPIRFRLVRVLPVC